MSQWLTDVIARAADGKDTLQSIRANSLAQLKQASWPNRRTEAWRYTSLHPVENLKLEHQTGSHQKFDAPDVANLNSFDLILVNGALQTDISQLSLPSGVQVQSLAQSPANADKLNLVKPQHHLFGLVNDVLATDGIFIHVAEGVNVEQPIRVINYTTEGVEAHTRVVVELEKNAKCTVIEHGTGNEQSLNTVFSEYVIGDHASLEHYRFALHGGAAIHVGGCHFKLQQESKLNSTLVGYGSELSRIDADIIHTAEHAHAKMNAIYLLGYKEHFDLHTNIEHTTPNGTSEENARGIVGDKARATFNGRIHIHRDAQKTLAELNNRNLLLSRGGQINTKPELEIYADDVQCAHGATVAEISEEALYYLLSRGITKSNALVMLNFGFIQELVGQMPNKALAEWLQPQLRERFEKMSKA